jgi:hypothetical protein
MERGNTSCQIAASDLADSEKSARHPFRHSRTVGPAPLELHHRLTDFRRSRLESSTSKRTSWMTLRMARPSLPSCVSPSLTRAPPAAVIASQQPSFPTRPVTTRQQRQWLPSAYTPECTSTLVGSISRQTSKLLWNSLQSRKNARQLLVIPDTREAFSACITGLPQRKSAFFGLGLDSSVDQSPSPAARLASPFAWQARLLA